MLKWDFASIKISGNYSERLLTSEGTAGVTCCIFFCLCGMVFVFIRENNWKHFPLRLEGISTGRLAAAHFTNKADFYYCPSRWGLIWMFECFFHTDLLVFNVFFLSVLSAGATTSSRTNFSPWSTSTDLIHPPQMLGAFDFTPRYTSLSYLIDESTIIVNWDQENRQICFAAGQYVVLSAEEYVGVLHGSADNPEPAKVVCQRSINISQY